MSKAQGDRTIYSVKSTTGTGRRTAHKMFKAGATVDEVIAATGLKRITINTYFWESKQKAYECGAIKRDTVPESDDPLLD